MQNSSAPAIMQGHGHGLRERIDFLVMTAGGNRGDVVTCGKRAARNLLVAGFLSTVLQDDSACSVHHILQVQQKTFGAMWFL